MKADKIVKIVREQRKLDNFYWYHYFFKVIKNPQPNK